MKKYRMRRRRAPVTLLSALAVLVGLGLVLYSVLGGSRAVAVGDVSGGAVVPPRDASMTLTVPEMLRVDNVPVYTAPASDEATLDKGALHVEGTGWPWEPEANVYIAGHRLGLRGTGSLLLFYDLDRLQKGNSIILTDSGGTRYTYRVFRKFVVDPSDYHVTEPIPGKNIVSLQTCTLPDYSQRLIVQGELVGVS